MENKDKDKDMADVAEAKSDSGELELMMRKYEEYNHKHGYKYEVEEDPAPTLAETLAAAGQDMDDIEDEDEDEIDPDSIVDLYQMGKSDYGDKTAILNVVRSYPDYFQYIFENRSLDMNGWPQVARTFQSESCVAHNNYHGDDVYYAGQQIASGIDLLPVGIDVGKVVYVVFEEQGILRTQANGQDIVSFTVSLSMALDRVSGLKDIFKALIDDEMLAKVNERVNQAAAEIESEKQERHKEFYKEKWGQFA